MDDEVQGKLEEWVAKAKVLFERMSVWLYVSVALVAIVAFLYLPTIGVMLKVAAKATVGLWIGYWADRTAFKDYRPQSAADDDIGASYMMRRAILMSACVVGLTLGV